MPPQNPFLWGSCSFPSLRSTYEQGKVDSSGARRSITRLYSSPSTCQFSVPTSLPHKKIHNFPSIFFFLSRKIQQFSSPSELIYHLSPRHPCSRLPKYYKSLTFCQFLHLNPCSSFSCLVHSSNRLVLCPHGRLDSYGIFLPSL